MSEFGFLSAGRAGQKAADAGAKPDDRLMLQGILSEAFNVDIFVRVDNILKLAGTNDAGCGKVSAILDIHQEFITFLQSC